MSPHRDERSKTGNGAYSAMSNGADSAMPSQNGGATRNVLSNGGSEASAGPTKRALPAGFYVPTIAIFDPLTEDLDDSQIARHVLRLAQAGVVGLVVHGSTGEAVHLTRQERNQVTSLTRRTLDTAGYGERPLIAGCAAQSTRETIGLCIEAAGAGADYALVLTPSYYRSLTSDDCIVTHFRSVADSSPIPILVYNFPAASAGLDLSSDSIIALSHHPNIVGCKLTCGNTGKLNRIVAATTFSDPSSRARGHAEHPFMCFGGSSDFTLQAAVGGGAGIIGGLGNIAPRACVKLTRLAMAAGAVDNGNGIGANGGTNGDAAGDALCDYSLPSAELMKRARDLQAVLAEADWAAIQGGVVSTKAALQVHYGYGGFSRKPLPRPNKEQLIRWRDAFKELVELEDSL